MINACHKCLKMKTKEINVINYENKNSNAKNI